MTLKRIALAFCATAVVGIMAAGSVAAGGIDLSPAFDSLAQQASPTSTPSPGSTGNAGLAGDGGSTPLMLGAALVLGAAFLAGTGRWVAARRS